MIGEDFDANEVVTFTFGDLSVGTLDFDVINKPVSTNTAGDFSATIQVPSLAAGVYPVTVTTSGVEESTQFQIIPGESGFAMQISPRFVMGAQGSSATHGVTLVPFDFNSQVTMSTSGLPSGITATFSPSTFTPSCSIL